jgi:hypothetical protein
MLGDLLLHVQADAQRVEDVEQEAHVLFARLPDGAGRVVGRGDEVVRYGGLAHRFDDDLDAPRPRRGGGEGKVLDVAVSMLLSPLLRRQDPGHRMHHRGPHRLCIVERLGETLAQLVAPVGEDAEPTGMGVAVVPDIIDPSGCAKLALDEPIAPWTVNLATRPDADEPPRGRGPDRRVALPHPPAASSAPPGARRPSRRTDTRRGRNFRIA